MARGRSTRSRPPCGCCTRRHHRTLGTASRYSPASNPNRWQQTARLASCWTSRASTGLGLPCGEAAGSHRWRKRVVRVALQASCQDASSRNAAIWQFGPALQGAFCHDEEFDPAQRAAPNQRASVAARSHAESPCRVLPSESPERQTPLPESFDVATTRREPALQALHCNRKQRATARRCRTASSTACTNADGGAAGQMAAIRLILGLFGIRAGS